MSLIAFWRGAAVMVLFSLAGCGGAPEGPPTVDIRGKVAYNGKPVEEGDIAFYPDGSVTGSATSGPIIAGEYNLNGRAAISAGSYRVEVRSYKRPPPGTLKDANGLEPPPAMIVPDQIIPDKFNKKSTIDKLVVSDMTKPITKDYDLKD